VHVGKSNEETLWASEHMHACKPVALCLDHSLKEASNNRVETSIIPYPTSSLPRHDAATYIIAAGASSSDGDDASGGGAS